LALRIVAGDRKVATITGPHAPGRPGSATGDPRARRLGRRRATIGKRQHDTRRRFGRAPSEEAGRIEEGGILGQGRMRQTGDTQDQRCTRHQLPSLAHTGVHGSHPQFTLETGTLVAWRTENDDKEPAGRVATLRGCSGAFFGTTTTLVPTLTRLNRSVTS